MGLLSPARKDWGLKLTGIQIRQRARPPRVTSVFKFKFLARTIERERLCHIGTIERFNTGSHVT